MRKKSSDRFKRLVEVGLTNGEGVDVALISALAAMLDDALPPSKKEKAITDEMLPFTPTELLDALGISVSGVARQTWGALRRVIHQSAATRADLALLNDWIERPDNWWKTNTEITASLLVRKFPTWLESARAAQSTKRPDEGLNFR